MGEDGGILRGRVICRKFLQQSLRPRAQICIQESLRMGLTLRRGEQEEIMYNCTSITCRGRATC